MNDRNPARYYANLTEQYRAYGGGARGWHWGLRDRGPMSHRKALLRSNEILLEGLDVGPWTRLLDVGFGDGGFAVWAASRFGCSVTAISICAKHLAIARRQARDAGVAKLCRFVCMDMNDLSFPEAAFDVVVNQETFCYATDKRRYLEQVRRRLAPGGAWCCIDSFVPNDRAPSRETKRVRRTVYDGFHFPYLPSATSMRGLLHAAGFRGVRTRDLTRAVLAHWRSRAPEPLASAMVQMLGAACFTGSATTRRDLAGHFFAGASFTQGLKDGVFLHSWYRAYAPAPRSASNGKGRAGRP